MLNRFVDVVKKQDTATFGIFKRNKHFTSDSLKCDLKMLSLAAFDSAEVAKLYAANDTQRKASPSKLAVQQLYQEHARGTVRSSSARAISEILGDSDIKDCGYPTPPSEGQVRNIIERYLEAEDNIELKAILDTLGRAALANVIQTKLRERHWFPVRTHDQALAFWKQASNSSLNVGAVSGSSDQGASFTEITSRFLHPLRISISAVLAAVKDTAKVAASPASSISTSTAVTSATGKAAATGGDSTSTSTVARFLNGGGLFNIAVAYPWLHLGTSSGAGDFVGMLASRVGGTLPVLGSTARDTTMLYDVGTEFFFKSTDRIDGIGFFMQSRIAFAGGSQRFMTLIGDAGKKGTAYQTMSVGLTIDDKYLITLSRTLAGPHSLQTGWQIGTTLARSPATPSSTP